MVQLEFINIAANHIRGIYCSFGFLIRGKVPCLSIEPYAFCAAIILAFIWVFYRLTRLSKEQKDATIETKDAIIGNKDAIIEIKDATIEKMREQKDLLKQELQTKDCQSFSRVGDSFERYFHRLEDKLEHIRIEIVRLTERCGCKGNKKEQKKEQTNNMEAQHEIQRPETFDEFSLEIFVLYESNLSRMHLTVKRTWPLEFIFKIIIDSFANHPNEKLMKKFPKDFSSYKILDLQSKEWIDPDAIAGELHTYQMAFVHDSELDDFSKSHPKDLAYRIKRLINPTA